MEERGESLDLESLREELSQARALNKELEAIFESSYDEIYVTDGQGVTLRVNAACERLYGIKAGELIGKHVRELEKQGIFSPSISPMVMKERKQLTILQTTRTGRKIVVTSTPIFDEDGALIRIVHNSRDITELLTLKKQLEDAEELSRRYSMELEELRLEKTNPENILAVGPKMRGILELGRKLARVDSTVLILGESGVGKNMLAKFIHRASSRGKGPFIEINCGAIPESLLESELFGYEEGAFTGARKGGKPGLIELANSGTLFLNEISELPLALQVKLLQVIQERSLTRVGGVQRAEIDVRLIAATNRDLEEEVRRGKFREDLYYRLNVVPVSVPPLRDRRDDVPILVHHFLRKISDRLGLEKKISPEAMDYLTAYSWPGNIRELENTVERLVVTTDDQVIDVADLPEAMRGGTGGAAPVPRPRFAPLERAVEEVERDLLRRAYKEFGNTYKMAEVLGVSQATVVRKMQKYFGRRA